MELFRGNLSEKPVASILTHYGTATAGACRIESTYATQTPRVYDRERFTVLDYHRRPKGTQTLEEALDGFIKHANQSCIKRYNVDFRSPLKLIDCWMDDPIGSAGLEAISPENKLTRSNRSTLQSLFHPFSKIIYPQNVMFEMTPDEIRQLLNKRSDDPLFQQEFKKRRERSSALGEDFRTAAAHEIVWVDLSLKLREWALINGYDSFIYTNEGEDKGSSSFVALSEAQTIDTQNPLIFDETRYRDLVFPHFKDFLDKIHSRSHQAEIYDVFWAGNPALDFWKPKTP